RNRERQQGTRIEGSGECDSLSALEPDHPARLHSTEPLAIMAPMDAAAVFELQRDWLRRHTRVALREAEPITADTDPGAELLLMEADVDAARAALEQLGAPAFDPGEPYMVRQVGTTCMSTSLANGMISLGEPFLIADPDRRVHLLTSDVVERTSSFGKPG